jgi:hypothetical protein
MFAVLVNVSMAGSTTGTVAAHPGSVLPRPQFAPAVADVAVAAND